MISNKPLKILNLDNRVIIDLELRTITISDPSFTVSFENTNEEFD